MSRFPVAADRPADFDAKVMAFYPGLLNLAWKITKNRDRQLDLVGDTIATALKRWQAYDSKYAIWAWLKLTMREVNRDAAAASRREIKGVAPEDDEDIYTPPTPASQADYAHLSSVLDVLSGIKHGNYIIRHAMGDKFREIAAAEGCTTQCIQMRHKEAMKTLIKRVGE